MPHAVAHAHGSGLANRKEQLKSIRVFREGFVKIILVEGATFSGEAMN
jgi:hypothetical protein